MSRRQVVVTGAGAALAAAEPACDAALAAQAGARVAPGSGRGCHAAPQRLA